MKFIVDRRTWYRGHGNQASKLLRADGMRCCIGFVAQQCGVPDNEVVDVAEVHQIGVDKEINKFPAWIQRRTSDLPEAYGTNDYKMLGDGHDKNYIAECFVESEEQREEKLKDIFSRNGDEIEFIN